MATGAPDYFKRILLHGVDEDGDAVAALVDADGRIIMVMSDVEDAWGEHVAMGLAELVACLGPAKRYDRRGQVVWLDSFEDGLVHVETVTSGEDAAVALEEATARTGSYSVKLTAGKTLSKYAEVLKRLYLPAGKAMGIEISWARVPAATYIDLALAYFPRGTYYYGLLRIDVANKKWQYQDNAGYYQDIRTDLTLYSGDKAYHTMKLVVDFENNVYVRAMLDEYEVGLANVALRTSTLSAGPYILAYIKFTDTAAANPYIYVDDVIVTQKEPA